ncbi:hypothetical protein B0H66DRAFT_603605 [Apodospora peruviana]|uniref:Uncharacterized protein n=1 Tax=Apodospora peruviana TaxID=516989 RepID=A0AAE0M4H4_9PEZI|nr:hypothetical protein B0H66DRAFT_603605 [Apodospora peruviana]
MKHNIMAKFSAFLLATALAVNSVVAKTPCKQDLDICGWALQNAGYSNEDLAWATEDAGQDSSVGTYIYDSIYNCYPNGEVVWSAWCGGGGQCNKAPSSNAHATCKGEPVYTGTGPWEGWDGSASISKGRVRRSRKEVEKN